MTNTDKIIAITNNSWDYYYLDWLNNFISVERFANHYKLSIDEALTLIKIGRRIHSQRVPKTPKS